MLSIFSGLWRVSLTSVSAKRVLLLKQNLEIVMSSVKAAKEVESLEPARVSKRLRSMLFDAYMTDAKKTKQLYGLVSSDRK